MVSRSLGPLIVGHAAAAPALSGEPRFLSETVVMVVRRRKDEGLGRMGVFVCPAWTVLPKSEAQTGLFDVLLLLLDSEKLLELNEDRNWEDYFRQPRSMRPNPAQGEEINELSAELLREEGDTAAAVHLLRTLRQAPSNPVPSAGRLSSALPRPLRRAVDLMRERGGETLSLDQLAEHTGIGKCGLVRSFRRHTGLSPHQLQINLRIEEAKRRVRQALELSETALDLGFYDQSHFTTSFGRYLGMSPARYRSYFQQDGER